MPSVFGGQAMRITAVHRYYWPDRAPYASILRQICAHWVAEGHEVGVLSAQPSYGAASGRRPNHEIVDGVDVRRVPAPQRGRWAALVSMVTFPAIVGARLLTTRAGDVVMCSTVPQVTLGAAVSAVCRLRGQRFVYHCMDLHPEIGALSGEFAHPLIFRTLRSLDTATMRRADAIVVLSADMERSVIQRDPSLANKVVVINNPALLDEDEESVGSTASAQMDSPLHLVFTGNLGRFQGLTDLVRDLRAVARPDRPVRMTFMGTGKAEADLVSLSQQLDPADGLTVEMVPPGTVAQARALMRRADLGVVSLASGVVRYAFPSKTQTYLAESLPLLVLCEQGAQLAELTRSEGIGAAIAPGDRTALGELLDRLHDDRAELAEMGKRAFDYLRRTGSAPVVLRRWSALMTSLNEGTSPRTAVERADVIS